MIRRRRRLDESPLVHSIADWSSFLELPSPIFLSSMQSSLCVSSLSIVPCKIECLGNCLEIASDRNPAMNRILFKNRTWSIISLRCRGLWQYYLSSSHLLSESVRSTIDCVAVPFNFVLTRITTEMRLFARSRLNQFCCAQRII